MSKFSLFLSILLILSVTFIYSQGVGNLKGDVKTLKYFSYEASEESDKIVKEELSFETIRHYDKDGNTEEYIYIKNEDTTFYNYHYDANGKLVETLINRNGEGNTQAVFEYNLNGNLTSCIQRNIIEDTLDFVEIYKYNESGVLFESVRKGADNNIKALFKYDTSENIVEAIYPWGSAKYSYDSLGRETSEIIFNSEGELSSKSFIKYENGLIKEYSDQDAQGVEESLTIYEYENFDHEGNWLKQVSSDGEFFGVVIREIIYY